ncbi:SDR family oxidoreductase [Mucilaginibacter sp. UR6-1]|uniref:SDR family NAD(P)-dependent oxidoreductase n=1 Tax=Mucilaginibacter sp. UR6-1 TaxID=1435643 RepID=UPI001E396D7D|nr:SDR family oxidoreductase [Mucilaginibacter sp. UR6-1]MCC8408297.1 SDR family oxidoreductase [Mucilaginibacter sp. UR6-1]
MGILQSKVAFITGADSGIGRATAIAFAKEGASVAICYHSDEEGAKETKIRIEEQGVKAMSFKLDVTEEHEVDQAIDNIISELGGLDILVNNAAVNGSNIKVADMETKTFDLCIRTNVYGPFFTSRKFVRHLAEKNIKGKIINISSIHEEIATPGNADYNASKGALRNFTRSLALELAESGTTVNNIAPGMILTPMNQKAMDDPEKLKEATAHIPAKRAGKPEEIAQVALFLASPAANYVTGSTYAMDGGLMINLGQGA